MRKILLVIDMQNDFIDGSLGTKEAQGVVDKVAAKCRAYKKEDIFLTRDTHQDNYLETAEGRGLPVPHCIEGTKGWEICDAVKAVTKGATVINKPTFGSVVLAEKLQKIAKAEEIAIEITGLCTDICVVSNALLIKACLPEIPLFVDASCCAGVTPESHMAALTTLKMCQINIQD